MTQSPSAASVVPASVVPASGDSAAYPPRGQSFTGAAVLSAKAVRATNQAQEQRRGASAAGFLAWFGIAFVVTFGIAWAYVAIMPMAFLSRDYPLWVAKRTMMDQCRLGSVLVFGDSRTMAATMPSVMAVPVTNLALSGASPIETYFAVRRALRCPTPPKLVVIAQGVLKFTGDADYWASFVRNGVLDYTDMREVDRDAAGLHDAEIIDLQPADQLRPALRELLFAMRFPPFYFGSLTNGFIAARWRHNRDVLRDSLLSSGHALFGTRSGSSDLADEGHNPVYRTSPLIDLYFSRTLALLADRNVPVVFLSMPINHATYARMRSELSEQFHTYLQTKARQWPGLRVVGPAIPCWPDKFFGDAWHLNARGATEYSRWLGGWLFDVLAGTTAKGLPNVCTDAATVRAEPAVSLR
jgi:hypothetical protein